MLSGKPLPPCDADTLVEKQSIHVIDTEPCDVYLVSDYTRA